MASTRRRAPGSTAVTHRFADLDADGDDAAGQLLVIGIDHHCAPIELREKVAYDEDEARATMARLAAAEEVAEVCLLSTCNRTEVYLLPRRDRSAYRVAFDAVFGERAPELENQGRFYVQRGALAARHLFEVAAGLCSMVLGEPEILGQVKKAAERAERLGASGTVLRRLLRAAVAAGGRARGETAISAGAVSFGYAVVDLARSIFERLEDCSVLMVGAGETARQVARNLIERGARELRVTNRGAERLEAFCELFPSARAVPFAERAAALAGSDVIVATTASAEPVIRRADLKDAMASRRSRPVLVVDLGVPRNVELDAGRLENLFLQDVDSLEDLIEHNLRRRREEIPRVQEILARDLERYFVWHRGLRAEPVVERLQKRAEEIRRREVENARKRFPEETHPHLERLTRALVRKILHHPSAHLRTDPGSDVRQLEVVRHLFDLDEE